MYSVRTTQPEQVTFIAERMARLFDMHRAFDPTYGVVDIEKIQEDLKKDQLSYLAFKDTEPVGFARGRYISQSGDKSQPYAVLHDMFVDEEHRCRNVGSMLLQRFEVGAKELGAKWVELTVDVRNEVGLSMWRASGFETYQLKMKKNL